MLSGEVDGGGDANNTIDSDSDGEGKGDRDGDGDSDDDDYMDVVPRSRARARVRPTSKTRARVGAGQRVVGYLTRRMGLEVFARLFPLPSQQQQQQQQPPPSQSQSLALYDYHLLFGKTASSSSSPSSDFMSVRRVQLVYLRGLHAILGQITTASTVAIPGPHKHKGSDQGQRQDKGLGQGQHKDKGLGQIRHQDKGSGLDCALLAGSVVRFACELGLPLSTSAGAAPGVSTSASRPLSLGPSAIDAGELCDIATDILMAVIEATATDTIYDQRQQATAKAASTTAITAAAVLSSMTVLAAAELQCDEILSSSPSSTSTSSSSSSAYSWSSAGPCRPCRVAASNILLQLVS